jgi:class 3 adenylate cyclase
VTTEPPRARLRHELRTPLNHIIGYGEMLLEDAQAADRPALAEPLRRILDAARRLLARINELLAPSGVDADAPDLGAARGELVAMLEQVAADVREAERQQGAGDAELAQDLGRIAGAAAELRALIEAPPAGGHHAPASGVAAAGEADRGVILVVDDDPGNRDVLARRLQREGYRAHTAADGRSALETAAATPVDLVLLDVMMPGLDGYEVLRRLKADPALRSIPVLMISALDEMKSVVRCIELGAEDYLAKPFDPVLLRARIGACLEKKRLHDAEARLRQELEEWNRTLERRVQEQVAQLERLGRLKRFFSPQLAEAIVAGGAEDPLRSHRREITVVFLDLRGFTAFAETAEPEEVMGVLAEYHAEMGRLIVEHEGTLERFTGDGMMVFFNDPVPVPDPTPRALRMAVAMRDRVAALAERWRARGHDLALGVGIAEGYATLGAIGFEGRWDYAAIGSVTNLAARLCGEARGGQILVSRRLLASAAPSTIEAEPVGELALKGFQRPVSAYSVTAVTPAPAAGRDRPQVSRSGPASG